MAPVEPEEEGGDDEGKRRPRDTELLTIERMWRMLEALDPDARRRVMQYLAWRSQPLLPFTLAEKVEQAR